MMKYKKRGGASIGTTISDLQEGSAQFARMAVYWGTACNSLQAQVKALLVLRDKMGILELCLVSPEDMDAMRRIPIYGYPVYYAKYPDGVTKFYPIPEQG